jgi:hypothetical protein
MWSHLSIFAVCAVFYLLIPGLGAFQVRNQWRVFRKRIADSALLPQVRYSRLARHGDGFQGVYRFFGNLEAIQGNDTIWLRSGQISLSVDLADVSIYLLPSLSHAENEGVVERNQAALPDEMPQLLPWNRVFSLPEGSSVYVTGALFIDRGQGVFRMTARNALTVVFYDGAADTILRRSIWGARQRNEYWNRYTPSSLIAGTLALLFLAYNFVSSGSALAAVLALGLSTTPILPFLPPGLPLYFAYRHFWQRGRSFRAERDILRLPMRYFGDRAFLGAARSVLPDGGIYSVRVYDDRATALEAMSRQKIRTTSLVREQSEGKYHVFGSEHEGQDGSSLTQDPMAEHLLIPGDPHVLTSRCERKARIREMLAAVAFIGCYVLNLMGVFALFNLWIV